MTDAKRKPKRIVVWAVVGADEVWFTHPIRKMVSQWMRANPWVRDTAPVVIKCEGVMK